MRRGLRLALCVPVVGICAGVLVAGVFATGVRKEGPLTGTRPSTPRVFAIVRTPGGVDPTLELRSGQTGALLKTLGALGSSWTNNGFAFSPDSRSVYLTLIGHKTLEIERISTDTGARSIIADGAQPAVSFDGRQLAFVEGGWTSTVLAIRDLASGRERRLDLADLLGRSYQLMNSSIAWTRDGSAVIVLAAHVAIADTAPAHAPVPTTVRSQPLSCTATPTLLCLIEIPATPGRSLRAERLAPLSTSRGVQTVTSDGSQPRGALLVSALGFGSAVDRIVLNRPTQRSTRILSLPKALLVEIDPSGSRVLYLTEGTKPALWRGQIRAGRLTQTRQLIPNVWLEAASW
jgi:hypothetical protein